MDWFVKRFLQSALVWLGLGVTLGVAMAVYPPLHQSPAPLEGRA